MKSSSRIYQKNETSEENLNPSKNTANDLEELVSLAEKTSIEIGNMREAIVNSRESIIYKIIIAYGAGAAATYIFIALEKYELFSSFGIRTISQIVTALVGMVIFVYFLKNILTSTRLRRKITKELNVEKEVHSKLISMVFDQFNRAKQEGTLTLISQALFEIRIQRLKTDI